jgi:hypothetical protein
MLVFRHLTPGDTLGDTKGSKPVEMLRFLAIFDPDCPDLFRPSMDPRDKPGDDGCYAEMIDLA